MKKFLLLCSIILLSACATGEQTTALLNSASNINEVIRSMGYPDQIQDMYDGKKLYVWNKQHSYAYTSPQYGYQTVYGATGAYLGSVYGQTGTQQNTIHSYCLVKVLVDSNGRIVNWTGEGNACP